MKTVVAGILSGLLAVVCQASLITTDPGTGTTTTFNVSGLTQGPGGFFVNGFGIFGNPIVAFGNVPYALGTNGSWNFSFVGSNNNSGSFTFDLGASFGLVGAFMNYSTPHDVLGVNPTIEALGADGTTVLESDVLSSLAPISTPGGLNQGAFRGILRTQNDIRFLRLSGDFVVTHSLEVGQAVAAVPEPGTFGLIFAGLCLVILGKQRRAALPSPTLR